MKVGIAIGQRALAVAVRRLFLTDGEHEVLWTARSSSDVLDSCKAEPPDLLLLELALPGVDAAELTRLVMAAHGCPILVLSAGPKDVTRAYDAMGNGAVDVVALPRLDQDGELVGGAAVLQRVGALRRLGTSAPSAGGRARTVDPAASATAGTVPLVAIGASTGGPAALGVILERLPADLGAALVIVQHIDDGFVEGLASWLTHSTRFRVSIAKDGEAPQAGAALVAAAGRHLVMRPEGTLAYVTEPAAAIHCPSVDVFFHSLATQRAHGLAVLLTGMGQDGATGLLALRRAGWSTVCQDQKTSAVWGMPRAAAEMGAAELVLGIEAIAPTIAGFAARAARQG